MDILDKFAAVEIQADTRISDCDRAFCLRQQEAFDKSGPALQRVVDAITEAEAQQEAIFKIYKDDARDYISGCSLDDVTEATQKRNKTFIASIVSHFSCTYSVKLDTDEIMEHLIPAAPKDPSGSYPWYHHLTEEERADLKAKMDAYKASKAAWEQSLRTLPLRYEQVVDEIFAQLGGFSFQERAMNEFLERVWNATHYKYSYSWNNIQAGQEHFEIKKAVLTLPDAVYYVSDFDEYRFNDDFKTVLEALAYYECGRLNEGSRWFPELFQYDTKKNFFEFPYMSKVKSIKLFKNGRADIRFWDAAYAQEFAEQCLRRRPVTMEQ